MIRRDVKLLQFNGGLVNKSTYIDRYEPCTSYSAAKETEEVFVETLSDQSHHGYEGLDTDLRYDMFMYVQYIIQGPDRTSIDFSLTQMPPRYFPAKFQEFFD